MSENIVGEYWQCFCGKRLVDLCIHYYVLFEHSWQEIKEFNCTDYTVLLYSQVHPGDQKNHDDLSVPVDEMITVF